MYRQTKDPAPWGTGPSGTTDYLEGSTNEHLV